MKQIIFENEFRCFVYNSKLTAISQYITCAYVDHDKNNIRNKISKFINKLNIPYSDCTIDILLDNGKCLIVEINCFGIHNGVGSCCYNWHIDYNTLYSDGSYIDVRIATDIKSNYEYTF